MNYQEFLTSKIEIAADNGFDIELSDISPILKPHQRDAVKWAIKGGNRALFESFGLGKTVQQLEIMRLILAAEGGKGLVVCPLGVRQEFKHDAEELLHIDIRYVKTLAECKAANESILITNYERVRDGDINPEYFTVTSLDEASVLRSYGSKTYQEFLQKFKNVRYKYVCTATPSPNKYKELIHYAGYLGIMDTGQALTRFFKRDSTQANKLTLYPHKEEEFWLWVSTWALFITKPSDLGYDDTGYDLPPMKVIYHEVSVDHSTAGAEKDGQGKLIRDAALGLKDAAREKRDSLYDRIETMKQIIAEDPEAHYLLWHDMEYERHAIKKAMPEAVEVYGSLDLDTREQRIIDFSHGRIKYLATKPVISGSGCNFQRYCHKEIFLGINYKFNNFIQAIHRVSRFLQDKEVEIHIIYTESEQAILDALKKKWEQHDYLVDKMTKLIKAYGLSSTNTKNKLARAIGIERQEVSGKLYSLINNDSVIECANMPDNSVGLIHTSIPFSNHYEYTPSYNDFGHNDDNDRFFEQMDYLTPELLRILQPGRVCAVHVKDRILFGNATGTGMPTVDPFSDITSDHFRKHGFQFFGRITIVTDVVRENNQTYRLGWSEQCKDGSKMGVGCPEYVLLFRKLPSDTSTAYADVLMAKTKQEYTRAQWQIDAHGYWRSSGNRLLTHNELRDIPVDSLQAAYRDFSRKHIYDYEAHVELSKELEKADKLPASFMVVAPGSWTDRVWDDINRMYTLNSEQARKNVEMHICPLQLDTVKRIINRFSNSGDVVLDPFSGLGTVPYVAVQTGRKGIGIELNHGSWKDSLGYLKAAELEISAPTLFDLDDVAGAVG